MRGSRTGDGAAGYRVSGSEAMPILTIRMVGREENKTVIGDVLRLTDNRLAEFNRVPVGELAFRVPLGGVVDRSWPAHAPCVCPATCSDCSSLRYPFGSTQIRKYGRSPPAAVAQ